MKKYNCPECGWKPPKDDIYEVEDGKIKKIKLDNFDDISESDKFYPEMIDIKSEIVDNLFEGTSWVEIHYCPRCQKEFSFENANY